MNRIQERTQLVYYNRVYRVRAVARGDLFTTVVFQSRDSSYYWFANTDYVFHRDSMTGYRIVGWNESVTKL
jgi:hypothetical protein